MSTTCYWAPNQTAQAQVETYTFTAPSSVGNTYTATINGKTVTYTSVTGDTATTVATAMYNLLSATDSVPPELLEISFDNPSAGVITATANEPGTPFANVTVNGVTNQGLVMSTGNGLANGISTAHTTANKSPSDVNDAQNWLRFNLSSTPPPGVRQLPQNGDDIVIASTNVPLLWNLDSLSTLLANTFTRWQDFTGTIGLPEFNPNGYYEWRATYFKFNGPAGSVPSGGLVMTLGYNPDTGNGPGRERYDLQSSRVTLIVLASGNPLDDYAIRFKNSHTDSTVELGGGASLGIATTPGETSKLLTVKVKDGVLGIGSGMTWYNGLNPGLTMYGGSALINSTPTLAYFYNGARATYLGDNLNGFGIFANQGSTIDWIGGGLISSLELYTGATFNKRDKRALTITDGVMDGDTCVVNDPLNAITWTNGMAVNERVQSGPFTFTGQRTVRIV